MAEDTAARLLELQRRIAEVERLRMQDEARRAAAAEQLVRIDQEIRNLGIDPAQIDAVLAQMTTELDAELTAIDAAVTAEITAYRALQGK